MAGANTGDYYRVLAHTGRGSWQPRADPHLWLAFNLRAHHMQAQPVARRISEAVATWEELDRIAAGGAASTAPGRHYGRFRSAGARTVSHCATRTRGCARSWRRSPEAPLSTAQAAVTTEGQRAAR